MTAEELDKAEKEAFVQWRSEIAQMEEKSETLEISPFEKNIEVWRQLWRVIERSQLLLQIVDSRNPYFFYSQDLEKYIQEIGDNRQYILLLNKADYLSPELIQHWNEYFKEKNIEHIFFSAKEETERLEKEAEEEKLKKAEEPQVDSELLSELKEEIKNED